MNQLVDASTAPDLAGAGDLERPRLAFHALLGAVPRDAWRRVLELLRSMRLVPEAIWTHKKHGLVGGGGLLG